MSQEKKESQNIKPDILKWVVIGLAGFAAAVLFFGAGVVVGGMKARFSYRWAESYHKNFAGPKQGFFSDWQRMPPLPGDFFESHGLFGEIIELKDNGFVVKDRGDIEKVVSTTDQTVIKKGNETIKDGLKVGDEVVIIGSPNEEGQIEAKLIRLFGQDMPKPPNRRP
jgi:hypothetical protein